MALNWINWSDGKGPRKLTSLTAGGKWLTLSSPIPQVNSSTPIRSLTLTNNGDLFNIVNANGRVAFFPYLNFSGTPKHGVLIDNDTYTADNNWLSFYPVVQNNDWSDQLLSIYTNSEGWANWHYDDGRIFITIGTADYPHLTFMLLESSGTVLLKIFTSFPPTDPGELSIYNSANARWVDYDITINCCSSGGIAIPSNMCAPDYDPNISTTGRNSYCPSVMLNYCMNNWGNSTSESQLCESWLSSFADSDLKEQVVTNTIVNYLNTRYPPDYIPSDPNVTPNAPILLDTKTNGDLTYLSFDCSNTGNTIVVGNPNTGMIDIYTRNSRTSPYSATPYTIIPSVSVPGDTPNVSMSGDASTIAMSRTSDHVVFIYDYNGNSYSESIITPSDNLGAKTFGDIVKLSKDGNTLAITYNLNEGGGHVLICIKDPNLGWIVNSNLDSGTGTTPVDYFGGSISMSDDALTIAIGAFGAQNIGGVYIYTKSTIQDKFNYQARLLGNLLQGGENGRHVALTGDGNTCIFDCSLGVFSSKRSSDGVWTSPSHIFGNSVFTGLTMTNNFLAISDHSILNFFFYNGLTNKWISKNISTATEGYNPIISRDESTLITGSGIPTLTIHDLTRSDTSDPFFTEIIPFFGNTAPGSADDVLDNLCSSFTRDQLSQDSTLQKICGCHLSTGKTLPSVNNLILTKPQVPNQYNYPAVTQTCDPICSFADTVPRLNSPTCPAICILDHLTINELNSKGDVDISTVCGNGTGTCYIDNTTIDLINSSVNKINISEKCGSCFTFDPNNPSNVVEVDCKTLVNGGGGGGGTGGGGSGGGTSGGSKSFWDRWKWFIIGGGSFVLFVIIVLTIWLIKRKK